MDERQTNYDLSLADDGLSKAVATMTLKNGGEIRWRFYTNKAPITCARIAQLISEGFYDGIIFHRVIPGFVVQGGDPTGTGTSGSGVKLKAEFNDIPHDVGIVSMARANHPDSADSQFFMMLGRHKHLDGAYTGFARITSGQEHVDGIRQGDAIATFRIE